MTPNTLANWNTNRLGGGTSPANFVTAGDIFVVQGTGNGGTSPHSMTTTATWTFGGTGSKLQIENGATLQADNAITITGTFQIDNGGNYIHNNTGAPSTTIFNGTESFGATSNFEIRLWGATSTSSTSGLTTSLTASISSGGNSYFYGNLAINTTGFTGSFSPGLTSTVRLCAGNFTVTSTGSGASAIFRFATAAAGPTVWVLGNYSQATGTKVDFNNNGSQTANTILSLGGNFTLTGTASLDNAGSGFAAISFVKSSGTQTVSVSSTAVQPWMLWTVGDGTTTNTVQLLSSIDLTGTSGRRVGSVTINANATLDLNGFTERIEGSTTGTVTVTGTLTGTTASSKLLFSASSTSTTTLAGAGTVNGSNLTIEFNNSGTGVNLISRDLTINTLTATAGTTRLNATSSLRTINLTNFSMAAGTLDTGSVDVTGNVTSIINLTGNFTKTGGSVSNTSPSGLGVFVFKGGGAESFSNTGTFQFATITITNSSSLTLNTAMAFTGVTGPMLTIDSGSTVTAGTQLISTGSASGNFVINGTLQTANTAGLSGTTSTTFVSTNTPTVTLGSSSTIVYNGTSSQTVTSRSDYANLTFNNSAGETLGGAVTVSGTLTLTAGTLSAGANNIDLAGDWIKTGGTFSASSGTVNLSGTNQSISGSNTFNNLTKNVATARTLTFGAGSTQTIAGTMNLQGASGQLLALRSSSPGSQWNINPQGTRTIAFLDVQDSNNTNATAINAVGTNSVNSGNNTNWTFASTNANLSNLVPNAGTLSPAFASATTSYTESVSNATSSMTVTPTSADATATIQVRVNGGSFSSVTSGSPSGSLSLSNVYPSTNTIDVKVTAQDTVTIKTYTITVTRRATQTITGLAATDTKTYGDASYSLSATGGASGNPVTYVSSNTGVATISGSTVTIVGAGSTTITASQAGNNNYDAAPDATQTLTVNRKAVTVTPDSGQNKIKGASDPTLTYTTNAGGLVNGDTLSGALARNAGESAGSYAITQGTITNANNPNYNITFTTGVNFVIAGALATNDSVSRTANSTSFKIPKTTLLANDHRVDTNGSLNTDQISISAVQSGTGNTVSMSGAFVFYTPGDPSASAPLTFTYTLSDAATSTTDTGTVTVNTTAAAPFALTIVDIASPPTFNGTNTSVTVDFVSLPNQTLNPFEYSTDMMTWTSAGSVSTGSTGSFAVTITAAGDHTSDWNAGMFFRATRQ